MGRKRSLAAYEKDKGGKQHACEGNGHSCGVESALSARSLGKAESHSACSLAGGQWSKKNDPVSRREAAALRLSSDRTVNEPPSR